MIRRFTSHFAVSGFLVFAFLGFAQHGMAADSAALRADLTDEMLDTTYNYYQFENLTQPEAEALFGSAVAAVYYPERGEVRLIAHDSLATAYERLASEDPEISEKKTSWAGASENALRAKLHSTATVTLRSFLDPAQTISGIGLKTSEDPYLIKTPSYTPAGSMPPETEPLKRREFTAASKSYYYLYDDFEGDSWAMWSRSDTTNGSYKWGVTSCNSHYGSYSADAARAGSQGAQLGCYSSYPKSAEMYMYFEACESVAANWKAFMEMQFKAEIDSDGSDRFGVYFKATNGEKWGWTFYGTWSGWFELVFNLRQWYRLGDLTGSYCNTLYLGFKTDATNNVGYGARVDDLYVYYGDTVGSYECAVIADPVSGSSPLTVAFRATTDMYSPGFFWQFGDGETSEQRDPAHVYQVPGSYKATLRATNSYGTRCYSSTTINVTQGTCSYTLSPSSASFNAAGGSGNFSVSASSGCGWTASSTKSWITINSGASGSGNGTVSYSVSENTSTSQRTGTIQAAGKTFSITQAGAVSCSYSISPTSRSFTADAGTGSVSVTTAVGCAWTATANKPWLSITSGSSGQGGGTVNYQVTENTSTSARTGTLTIAGKTFTVSQDGAAAPPPGDGEFSYFAVGVIHSGGAAGSNWRSTMVLRNRGDQVANVTMIYLGSKGERVTRTATIPARGMRDWDDTVPTLFGVGGNSSGIVQIKSDQALQASVRTYNITANGTFGQMLPGVSTSDSVVFGTSGILSPVQRTDAFRTNIGAINTGATACTVRVTFVSAAGQAIGSEVWFDLAPGEWKQNNDTLASAGLGTVDCAYALVDVFPDTGSAWAYATVIDNVSNDPTAVSVTMGE